MIPRFRCTQFIMFVIALHCLSNLAIPLHSQEIQIKPYLQDVEPRSAVIMWQTDTGDESIVEWGITSGLGQTTRGSSVAVNFDSVRLHTVRIEPLDRFTTYFYRIRTGKTESDIFSFRTPPFASEHRSFRFAAMSDMQMDNDAPGKFREIANDGLLGYLNTQNGVPLPDKLALVMVPGDLVADGTIFDQWKNHFFNPAEVLFSQIPVYPVPGNHERNSVYFFQYFNLPENGTPAYAEHWWYKDYGNIRIIGMDSNDGYRDLPSQLSWLDRVLEELEVNDSIDFVFAQMHHPFKSELWIPGEVEFTGEVVKRLEAFTEKTGKPSIHFFGHTHGYSRGQSRDHKHLWVNVATAGGAIDNWGEFEGKDYDEFTVTQDEYGFVIVEVDADKENPRFTLKRISRGNQYHRRDNELSDSIVVWKNKVAPQAPVPLSPAGSEIPPGDLLLKASPFQSADPASRHGASQWQISTDADFGTLIVDSWKQFENWYYDMDQQADDDLTDEKIYRLLQPDSTYYWRVRYRDRNLNWSEWSAGQTFKTSAE